jgi:predicted ArsR family transcriptional regulator
VENVNDRQERNRTKDGQYAEQVTPEDVLECFTDCEPRTAREIADELGIVRRTAHKKLTALAERGDLNKKSVGAHAVVFWRPERSREQQEGGAMTEG